MAEESPNLRRSGRKRRHNTRYTNDAFDGLGLDDEDGLDTQAEDHTAANDESADEDFHADVASVDVTAEQDVDLSQDNSSNNDDDDDNAQVEDDEMKDDTSQATPKRENRVSEGTKKTTKLSAEVPNGDASYTRAVRVTVTTSKKVYLEESECANEAYAKWYDDVTLPSRTTNSKGVGGMAYSFFQTEEQRRLESTLAWEWYDGGGVKTIRQAQRVEHITGPEALQYYPQRSSATTSMLMGPIPQHQLRQIDAGQVMDLNVPWQKSDSDATVKSGKSTFHRNGWLINAGECVQCLDWAADLDDTKQYLALSTLSRAPRNPPSTAARSNTAPLSTPADPSPASIQIWEFTASSTAGQGSDTFDMTTAPVLRAVLCLDWGGIKQFKWCPFHHQPPLTTAATNDPPATNLGLLAVLSADGFARVLDISLPPTPNPPAHLKFHTTFFSSRPPSSVFTTLAWSSPFVLLAGTSTGQLATFDLRRSLSPITTTSHPPKTYTTLHTSAILSLTPTSPALPTHLLSTSTTGFTSLSSLHTPPAHTAASSPSPQRTRLAAPPGALAWHDPTRHALFAAEDAQTLRAASARRFWASHEIARLEAQILAIAASPCHAAVLVATADGAVALVNPLRRLVGYRRGLGSWRQRWFMHEWRPAAAPAPPAPLGPALGAGSTLPSAGISRFVTGFAVEDLAAAGRGSRPTASAQGKRKAQGGGEGEFGAPGSLPTVHEGPTAARCVCWNPNVGCGGWAAAGVGAGWVVVEDLAVG